MNVLITGMGAYCALGSSTKELWEGIKEGKSGIGPIKRFDVTPFETQLGGMVKDGDDFESDEKRLMSYARKAANEALKNAKIFDNTIVTLVLGTSNGVRGKKIYEISYRLSEELNLGGMVISVSTACTSSSHAIGFAADLLRRGRAKFVIAGGVDVLTRDVFAGFHSLGLLSKTPCSPFSTSLGTTLGEGAAFLVMETEETARKRGIKPLAIFMGYGISADAFHDTKPDPSGSGICRAITDALRDSNLKSTDIAYINAHGTGTGANDSAEWRGIQSAFSDYSVKLPVSSSKSFLGHAQGAAGALEVVTTLLAMQHNVIPPTLNYVSPRPFSPNDPVATPRPRRHITKFALCTNSAFGGVNAALIFGRKDVTHKPSMISPRSISVMGYGLNLEEEYINRFIPYDDLRGIDISARLLAGVVAMILNNSGIKFRSKECESIGLFVGQDNLSVESMEDFEKSIKDRGIKHLSASAFTRMVINYPAGVCCRLFGLKGPVSAISAKPESGMTAFCLGADSLTWRNDTDAIIIASVNDNIKGENKDACAVGFLLKAEDDNSPIRLAGWSMSGNSEETTEEALKMAKLRTSDFSPIDVTSSSAGLGLCALFRTIENSRNVTQQYFLIKGERELSSMGIDIIIERRDNHAKGAEKKN